MTTFTVESSQNVGVQYQLADLMQRIGAYLLDILFLFACYTVVILLMVLLRSNLNSETITFIVIIALIPTLFYRLLTEIFMNGQTIGKQIVGIRVIKIDGSQAGIGNYLLRWIFQIIDFYLLSGAIAIIMIITGKQGQRLGDLVAGTTVVKSSQKNKMPNQAEIHLPADYQPVYPEAARLDEKHIRLIHKAIQRKLETLDDNVIIVLDKKLSQKLSLQHNMRSQTFLNTLLKDYKYYSER
ncbi:MAG: RDD family protein [Cyclobacteriaceae bacterium]|nr:RDD family protein [Cyclobacteriaceae bacterium]